MKTPVPIEMAELDVLISEALQTVSPLTQAACRRVVLTPTGHTISISLCAGISW